MSYKYTHFIPQNIAPSGATSIGVYDSNGNKVCEIPLGRLAPPNKEKLYSFGLLSDIHLWKTEPSWNANTKFDNALTYFENEGCEFCVVCGDLTQTGFYLRTDENDASTTYLDLTQFAKYKEICDNHTIPVHELMGNHESYYSMPITNNLDKMETYTGKGVLSYTVEQGNDLFILLGQPRGSEVMSDADYEWFENLLADNQNKRCFVFVHSYIEEDSGDAKDFRENSIFDSWGTTKTNAFKNLINQYPNIVLFHGHSHIKFECQEMDKTANYTEKNGFKSVHIPSLGRPRNIDESAETTPYEDSESQGYVVDVYDDCIVLNGMDLIDNIPIPLGTYKIDTPLQTIPAGTFTDDTGTITIL
jgi:hypothetical protein